MAEQNIYIDSTAAGGGDGSALTPYNDPSDVSDAAVKAWRDAGDDVFILLKRGSVFANGFAFTEPWPTGSAWTTIQAYGYGDLPWIDGDQCKPIDIDPVAKSHNLKIQDIDISGQGFSTAKDIMCQILWTENIVLDGIVGDGHRGGQYFGKNCIFVGGTSAANTCSGTIEIKNLQLKNYGPEDVQSGAIDYIGLVVGEVSTGTLSIHGNNIGNVQADCIQLYKNTIATSLYGNTLFDPGENCVDLKSSSNVDMLSNTMSIIDITHPGDHSLVAIQDPFIIGGINNVSVNFNTINCVTAGGVKIKDVSDIEIIGNTFSGGNQYAIDCEDSDDILISRNRLSNHQGNIAIQDTCTNVDIIWNLFVNPIFRTGYSDTDAGCIDENNSGSGIRILGNAFIDTLSRSKNFIALAFCNETLLQNNIFSHSTSGADAYSIYYKNGSADPIINHCNHYNPNSDSRVKLKTVVYESSDEAAWISTHDGDSFTDDPQISSTGKISKTSPCVNAGTWVPGINDGDELDIWGFPVYTLPNIGPDQYWDRVLQGGAITSAGSTLYIAENAELPTNTDEEGYESLTWVKVGMITEIPEFMPSATINTVMILDSRVPLKTKGSTDPGDMTIPMVRDVTDTGQAIIKVASRDDRSYSWKIETSSDFTPIYGHPLTFYGTAKVGGYSVAIGGVDSTIMSNVPFALDRMPIESPAL